jgi:S-DNA-T family DNA segregation ATPase FtsK/SpoIIIE
VKVHGTYIEGEESGEPRRHLRAVTPPAGVDRPDLVHEPGTGLRSGNLEGEHRDPDHEVRKVTLPAEPPKTVPQRVADAQAVDRAPIIPVWVKTSEGRRSTTRGALDTAAYTAGFHTIRAPWYLGKVVVLAPVGALKVAESVRRFVFDHAGREMRLKVAASNDPKMHALLVRQRDAIVGRRLAWVAMLAVVLSVAYVLAWWLLPAWAVWGIWTVAAVALARHGAPAAHPLVAQSVVRRGPPPITDFSMARALAGIGIPDLTKGYAKKETAAWFTTTHFPRTAVGVEVQIELPHGVTAAEVAERREKLAAGLRRPIGAVWPMGDHKKHPGWLVVHVLDAPMSEMKQPVWPLARGGKSDMFKPLLLGWDQRGLPVRVSLMFTNLLVGAIPRQGKSWTVRVIALAAAFDVTCELHLHELKGTNDYAGMRSFAHRFTTGAGSADEPAIESVMASLREVYGSLDPRAKTISRLGAARSPDAKVTRALSDDPTLGLHPVLLVIDEVHELFESKYAKEAEQLLNGIIKRGPALGIMLILATQNPNAKSIPTSIKTNMGSRLCLRVGDSGANNNILGNGAYAMGMNATLLNDDDLGIGLLRTGGTSATTVRAALIDGRDAERIGARAHALRTAAGRLTGDAVGQVLETEESRLLVVQDAVGAWTAAGGDDPSSSVPGGPSAWLHRLEEAMADRLPGRYGDLDPGWLGPRLRSARVATLDARNRRVDGEQVNRAGVTLDALRRVLEGTEGPA